MVKLGYVAKGYRMREDQRRQEELQKEAMAFKREQFDFTKKSHAENLALQRDRLKNAQQTAKDKSYFDIVKQLTGPKADPRLQITPAIAGGNENFGRLIKDGLVQPIKNAQGQLQYFPSTSSAAFSSTVLKNRSSLDKGVVNPDELSPRILKKIIENHSDYKSPEDKEKILKIFRTSYSNNQTRTALQTKAKIQTAFSAENQGNIITIKDKTGKAITHLSSAYTNYKNLLGNEERNPVRRNMADVNLWENNLANHYDPNDPQKMALYRKIIQATPKHIIQKFMGFGQKGTNRLLSGGNFYEIDQRQYKHLSLAFPQLVSNIDLLEKIASENNVSVAAVKAGIDNNSVQVNEETIEIEGASPKRIPNSTLAPVPKRVSIYKVDRAKLRETHERLKQGGRESVSVAPKIISSNKGKQLNSPIMVNTENEQFDLSAVELPLIAKRNPEGVYFTPQFTLFSEKNPSIEKEELLKRINEKYKPLTDKLYAYVKNSTKENLEATMVAYREQEQYKDLDNKELQKVIGSHRKAVILDKFKSAPPVMQVDGVRQQAGYAAPIVRRRGDDLTPGEQAREKANNNAKDKISKLKPMLVSYKRARSTVNLLAAYENGSITDVGTKKLIEQLARSPALLEQLKSKDRKAYDTLIQIANSKSYDADLFGTIDTVFQSVKNLFNSVSYVGNSLSANNLAKFARTASGNVLDIDNLVAPNNENARGWDTQVGSKLNRLRQDIEEERKIVDSAIRNADNPIARAKAIARGEMLMLRTSITYYYAGLVQGESGGRAISNEDFENIYNALWTKGVGGYLALGALNQLEATFNGIERRANALHQAIGYGLKGDTTYEDSIVEHERSIEKLEQAEKLKRLQRPKQLTSADVRQRGVPGFITLKNAADKDQRRKSVALYNKITSKSKSNLVEVLKANNLQPKRYEDYNTEQQKDIRRSILAGLVAGPYNMSTQDLMESEGIPANNVTMFNNLSENGNLGDLFNKAIKKRVTSDEADIVNDALIKMFVHMTTRGV